MKSGNPSNIKGVIFDYGEVLCSKPADDHLRRMAEIFSVSPREFVALYDKNRRAYDRGDLTPQQYWSTFAESTGTTLTPEQLSQIRAWDVEMWSNLNPTMIGWLQALRSRGMRTALLSNMHLDMVAKVRHEFSWLNDMNFAVFSHEVRLAKPEVGIYEHCLHGLGTQANETLFIDDREPNISAAQALGIRAIQFQSSGQLRKELEALNFAPLPN